MLQHFFLGDEYIASAERPMLHWRNDPENVRMPASFHFFCTECGTVWARAIVEDEDADHETIDRSCRECQSQSFPPAVPALAGGIFYSLRDTYMWDIEMFNYHLPIEVLVRDFQFLFSLTEKGAEFPP